MVESGRTVHYIWSEGRWLFPGFCQPTSMIQDSHGTSTNQYCKLHTCDHERFGYLVQDLLRVLLLCIEAHGQSLFLELVEGACEWYLLATAFKKLPHVRVQLFNCKSGHGEFLSGRWAGAKPKDFQRFSDEVQMRSPVGGVTVDGGV